MSEQKETEVPEVRPEVRSEEPELSDDALEKVAGGCEWTDSMGGDDQWGQFTIPRPTL